MRLTSWKEIAAYLGRDVRTVMRWHKERGLPVHRAPGGQKGSVFAFKQELDDWLRSGSASRRAVPATAIDEAPAAARTSTRFLVAATLLTAAVIATALVALRPPAAIHDVILDGRTLAGRDAAGVTIWRYALDAGGVTLSAKRPFVIADLDHDGSREAVIAIRHTRAGDGTPAETLLCIDARGQRKWAVSLADEVVANGQRFGPPWRAEDMTVVATPSGVRVAVAVHHDVWWPSFVAFLDRDGRVRDKFVHGGWITRLATTATGDRLLAAGFDNARDASTLLLLEPSALSGPAARHVSLPRTEINRTIGHAPVEDHLAVHGDGTIVLRVPQHHVATDIEAVYEFGPDLSLKRAAVSDVYWQAHRRLEEEGRLSHSADACPERRGLAPITR